MTLQNIFKIWALGLVLATLQACASSPDTKPQKSDDHIKTDIPPPFPITPESLRKEREDEKKHEQDKAE